MIIVGNVDECLDKFERYQRVGCDSVLAYVQFGHLPHEAIMQSIDLIGTKIIPQLEKNRSVYPTVGVVEVLETAGDAANSPTPASATKATKAEVA
jgi:hypothetical protein